MPWRMASALPATTFDICTLTHILSSSVPALAPLYSEPPRLQPVKG
jgi:hypothetical protein